MYCKTTKTKNNKISTLAIDPARCESIERDVFWLWFFGFVTTQPKIEITIEFIADRYKLCEICRTYGANKEPFESRQ